MAAKTRARRRSPSNQRNFHQQQVIVLFSLLMIAVQSPLTAMELVPPCRVVHPGWEGRIMSTLAEYIFTFEQLVIAQGMTVTRRVYENGQEIEDALRLNQVGSAGIEHPDQQYMFVFQMGTMFGGYFILRVDREENALSFHKAFFEDFATDRGVSSEFVDRTDKIIHDLMNAIEGRVE